MAGPLGKKITMAREAGYVVPATLKAGGADATLKDKDKDMDHEPTAGPSYCQ